MDMEIAQIIGLALITTIFLLVLRQEKPVMAVLLSLVFAVVIFSSMMGKLASIIDVMGELTRRAGINNFFLGTILKIIIENIPSWINADQGAPSSARTSWGVHSR